MAGKFEEDTLRPSPYKSVWDRLPEDLERNTSEGLIAAENRKKIKLYNIVQKVITNLAKGGAIRPFGGENMLNTEQTEMFNQMVQERIPSKERLAIPRSSAMVHVLTGYDDEPLTAAKALRIPRLRKGGYY